MCSWEACVLVFRPLTPIAGRPWNLISVVNNSWISIEMILQVFQPRYFDFPRRSSLYRSQKLSIYFLILFFTSNSNLSAACRTTTFFFVRITTSILVKVSKTFKLLPSRKFPQQTAWEAPASCYRDPNTTQNTHKQCFFPFKCQHKKELQYFDSHLHKIKFAITQNLNDSLSNGTRFGSLSVWCGAQHESSLCICFPLRRLLSIFMVWKAKLEHFSSSSSPSA